MATEGAVEAVSPANGAYGFAQLPEGRLSMEPIQTVRECFTMGTTPNFGFSSRVVENNYVRFVMGLW